MSSINFIGGEKGGVGKSVVSRALAQYFIDRQLAFAGFDTDRSHQTFRRFYADYAYSSVVDSYESLDAIAESLVEHQGQRVLVDLAAQTFDPLARWIEDSDLFSVLEELSTSVNFWHVMDGSKDSVELLNKLFDTYGDRPNYIVVLNYGRCSDFAIYEQSKERQRAASLGAKTIALPKMHEASMQKIDMLNTSFWAAVNLKSSEKYALKILERQRVKVWLQKTYEAFDSIKL